MEVEKHITNKQNKHDDIEEKIISEEITNEEESLTKNSLYKTYKSPFKFTFSKRNIIIVSLLLLLGVLIGLKYKYRNEFIVARVNGKAVTRIELWKALEQDGGSQVLDTLITKKLIMEEAEKQGVVVTQQDINLEIQNIENTLLTQGSTLEQALTSQKLSIEQLNEQIKFQKILEGLVGKNTIAVTDEEVDTSLKQVLDAGQKNTPELRDQVKAQLEQAKLSQAMQSYIVNIKKNAKINILNKSFVSTQATP